MPEYRICIFLSDTGNGHRSAAEAIEAALRERMKLRNEQAELVIITEDIAVKTHFVNRCFVELYNFILRHHQKYMKYYYWFIQTYKPNDYWLGHALTLRSLKKIITNNRPSIIVSVHPMINHYLARSLKELGLESKVKLIEVVTDPNADLWKAWACTGADLIIAPNDLAAEKLIACGTDPEKIEIIGMPVHPRFLKLTNFSRDEFLKSLSLDINLPTVCMQAGGSNILGIYQALLKTNAKVQVVFMCEHDEQLYQQVSQLAQGSSIPTKVMRFTHLMPELMSSSDLLVTKPGGLTVFEAIASGIPLALDMQGAVMPQEIGTAKMLVEEKLAMPIYHPDDIKNIVPTVKILRDRDTGKLPSVHNLNRTNAVYDIAEIILTDCILSATNLG